VTTGPFLAVLDYGIGNLRSAEKALQRVGAGARLVSDPTDASGADGVVLPGVGAFGACADALVGSGLHRVVLAAVDAGTPFLAICVGMQLLYEGSVESPAVEGLGVLDGTVDLIAGDVKRPQMQWNTVEPVQPHPVHPHPMYPHPMFGTDHGPERPVGDRWMYFVHSYAAPLSDVTVATCDYGGPVVAAVASGSLWATQFHPEKSGASGLALLERFVEACR